MSKWLKHVKKWSNCDQCELCYTRSNVVLARGVLPCHILFIGEAPGISEDTLGKPFIGPAGKLMDSIVEQAIGHLVLVDNSSDESLYLTWAFTNIISCIPLDNNGRKVKEPPTDSINACADRLVEFVEIAQPGLIVCVGKLSSVWSRSILGEDICTWADVVHPAAILRMQFVAQGLAVQEAVVTIQDAVEEVWEVSLDAEAE